jgi:hypothetical protein
MGSVDRANRAVVPEVVAATPSEILRDDEDGDLGFLDLIEMGGAALAEFTDANLRIGQSLNELNEKVTSHTADFEALATYPENQKYTAARRVADSFAEDMTLFAKRVEIETPTLTLKLKTGIDVFTKALLISVTWNPSEIGDAKTAILGCTSLLETLDMTGPKIQGLCDKVVGLPSMTKTTNRARKRLAEALRIYISEIQNARKIISEMLDTLTKALTGSEARIHDHASQ